MNQLKARTREEYSRTILAKRIRTWIEEDLFRYIELKKYYQHDEPILNVLRNESTYERQITTALSEIKLNQRADLEYATQVKIT